MNNYEKEIEKTFGEIKSAKELYNGVDKTDDLNYKEEMMYTGNYVNYTAGTWNTTNEVTTSSPTLSIGGYVAGQSRDTNAKGLYTTTKDGVTYGSGGYEVWRISKINDDGTVELIYAGCPEIINLYSATQQEACFNVQKILTGETEGQINDNLPSTPKDFSVYINENQNAIEARSAEVSDMPSGDLTFNEEKTGYAAVTENRYVSLLNNNCYYQFPDIKVIQGINLWCQWDADGSSISCPIGTVYSGGKRYGIRVVIKLSSDTLFAKSEETVQKDGFTYNKWIIK